MHLARQIGVQTKPGERQPFLPHHHVDVHVDHHRHFALSHLLTDDHGVIRNLDRGRRQFANGDFTFWHVDRTGNQQGVVCVQRDVQIGRHVQLGVRLHRHRQMIALDQHVDGHRLAPCHVTADAALPLRTAGPAAVELRGFADDVGRQLQVFKVGR